MSEQSSPIRINEATAAELCLLPMIGEKRAERILRYREEVGPVDSVSALANAAGINHQLAETIANDIDWGNGTSTRQPPLLAVASLVVTAGVIAISLFTNELDTSSSGVLYNSSVILILAGCGFGAASILTSDQSRIFPAIRLATLILLACGASLFAALVLKVAMTGGEDPLSIQILTSWTFALFVLIVVSLQLGPDLVMRVAADRGRTAARLYDLLQLPLGIGILLLVPIGQDDSLMEEIFCLWAGVVLVLNGRLLMTGTSSFAGMLGEEDRAVLDFVMREDSDRVVYQRLWGIALAATGALVAWSAVNGWI